MPTIAVKLYSTYHKLLLKHRIQNLSQNPTPSNPFGTTSRPQEEHIAPPNPTFTQDGIASKDIHIDPFSSLSLRIFLPQTDLNNANVNLKASPYKGYSPNLVYHKYKKLPVILQFHGGGFVSGSNDSVANDVLCRRVARGCEAVVVAVGYRLAPENKFPAAFDDGMKVLNWLVKQANLVECGVGGGIRRRFGGFNEGRNDIVDGFGSVAVEPWLAAHGDFSRCVLLGASSGANIANYVARKAVEAGKVLDPVKIVAQVLMYPFFAGNTPTRSEIKLSNSYFYDKATCKLLWKLFLPEDEFNLDHPAANPLIPGTGPSLKLMPPTLTVVAQHDWMRDRAIAYSEELRKVNIDAPVLDYKDAVHEFATHDLLLKTPKALACAEDIAIWMKKYISIRGHEFSY